MIAVRAQDAHRRRAELEVLRFKHRQADPARAEHGAELPVREQRDIPLQLPQSRDQTIDTFTDFRGRLAARAAVAKEVPTWALLADVDRPLAFVVAVAPLGEIGFDFGATAEAHEFAGRTGAEARARQHVRERYLYDPGFEGGSLHLAISCQRNVGYAGMPSGQRPRRFPVPEKEQPFAQGTLGHSRRVRFYWKLGSIAAVYWPRRAARLQTARWSNARWASVRLASLPAHIVSAGCWIARAKENVNAHGAAAFGEALGEFIAPRRGDASSPL